MKAIVELYKEINKLNTSELNEKLALLAPTGRAAKRMSESTLYKASTIHRFLKWNKENDSFNTYKNKVYDKNSLVYDDVKSLMQDREGIIWVGTYSGVSIFDTESGIKHYKAGLDDDYLLNENMVHGVY